MPSKNSLNQNEKHIFRKRFDIVLRSSTLWRRRKIVKKGKEIDFNKLVEDSIQELPARYHDRVRKLVDEFTINGKGNMLGVLSRAHAARKLGAAMQVLEQHFLDHWQYQPRELRGSMNTAEDFAYIRKAYREIGLPASTQRG